MTITAATLITRIGVQGADGAKREISSFGDSLSNMARSAGATGAMLSMGVTAPLVAMATAALTSAAGFEQSMNVLQQVTGASEGAMSDLTAEALRLGAVTSFSAGEAADAMLELGKAGMSTDEIMASIGGVMSLAAAGGIELAQAAGITAAALNAFGLEASEANRVADLLAATANASAADISDLAQGFQQAGFAFAAAGQPIDDLAASLAILTNVGLTGSDAGTALKNALMQIMAPTVKAKDAMAALGISFFDAQGDMLSMAGIIDVLNSATAGMTQEQRNATLATIFLSDGMKAMIPLLNAGSAGFIEMKTAVNEQGAASDVAGARMKGLAGAVEYFKGSVDSFLIGTAVPYLDWLGQVVTQGADLLTAFGELPAPVMAASLAFAGVLAAAGPLLLVVAGVSAALAFMLSPIGLVILAVGALAAAWASDFGGIQEKTTASVAGVTASLKSLETALAPVQSALDNWLANGLPAELAAMEADWTATWGAVQAKTAEADAVLSPIFARIDAWFATQLSKGLTTARTDWATTLGGFVANATETQTALTPIFAAIRAAIGAEMKRELAVMGADWEATWSTLAVKASATHAELQPIFDAIVLGLATSIPAALTAVQADWDATWAAMAAKVTDVWDKVQSFFAWLNLTGLVTSVIGSGGGGVGAGALVPAPAPAPAGAPGAREPQVWLDRANPGPGIWGGGSDMGGMAGATGAMPMLVWADYVEPLTWADYVTAIAWEDIIPSFKWLNYVYVLNWANYVTDLSWGEFIRDMKWSSYVSDLSWGQFVPTLNWGAFIPAYGGGGGGGGGGAAAVGEDWVNPYQPGEGGSFVVPTASAAGVTVQITGPVSINNMGDIESVADQIISAMRRRM